MAPASSWTVDPLSLAGGAVNTLLDGAVGAVIKGTGLPLACCWLGFMIWGKMFVSWPPWYRPKLGY